jgi:uncharacterized membrane protein YbhN (UPF0104 family)
MTSTRRGKARVTAAVRLLRAPATRVVFLVLALAAAAWAVMSRWEEVRRAVQALSPGTLALALALGLVYVAVTMLSWRAVLTDLGSQLPVSAAGRLFFVSQIGKYLPGGIWNVLAAAEMGVDHEIPRRRSVAVMIVSLLVSIVTGLALAVGAVAVAPRDLVGSYGWVVWALPLFVASLLPPVLNRFLDLALRLTRRPPLEHPLTARGIAASGVWALLSWLIAGALVWIVATAVGMAATTGTFALAVGGYALAWTVGFLVVVAPAGVGVREAVLAAVLAGRLDAAGVVVTVLLARIILTVADVVLGLAAASAGRRRALEPRRP